MPLKRWVPALLLLAADLAATAATVPALRPQWPPPPDPARLQYLAEITVPRLQEQENGKGWLYWLKFALGVQSAAEKDSRKEALLQPTGLFARDDILYVADPGRAGVLRYDLAKRTGRWLEKPQGGGWASPVAVAASASGRLYILDSVLMKVFILDAEGKTVGELQGDPQGLGRPAGLALSQNRVYVSDVLNHRIMVYGLEGTFVQSFGVRGSGPGELNFPTYLWFDRNDHELWVSDSGNFRIQRFDPNGRPLGRLCEAGDRPGFLARPRGLARDSEGHVYISDGAFDALQLFDIRGHLLLFAGESGAQPGQFNLPGGVFIDEKDRVFVADTQNGRVQIFQYFKEGQR